MRTKTVRRHWCDFCNKAGLQAHAMARHEKHCTMNPARDCRVCGLLGGSVHVGAERMASLVAMLPDPAEFLNTQCWTGDDSAHARLVASLKEAMAELRKEVDNCPACILAALRQKKIPAYMAENFNFTSEMKAIFADIDAERRDYF